MRLLLLSILILHFVQSYKILVYNSKFGHSHSNYMGRIADILVEAGHNVTSLLPILDPGVRDGTEKSNKIHVQPDPVVAEEYTNVEKLKEQNFFVLDMVHPIVPFIVGPSFADQFYRTCKRVIEEPGLIERLKAEQFDVMIVENFDVCGTGLSHVIAPKSLIGLSTTCLVGWQFDEFGIPQANSYRPAGITANFDVHSFKDRLFNLYGDYHWKSIFGYSRKSVHRVLQEHFGEDYPSIAEISSNVAYVFTNSETLIESAAPTTARVIDLPGLGVKQPKKLDEHWEAILNLRPKTILLSFGTIAKSILMPLESKMGLLKTIAAFPDITFIWKYEETDDEFSKEHAAKVPNLILSEWMPQVDILAHPKLSVFITHGGMGSTQETALRGKPGIFIPLFAEQARNAGMAEFNGFGKVYSKWELHDSEKLIATIREVLENEKYQKNAEKVSRMLAKKPFTSRELLIKHVEFAAEFGPSAALRPQSVDMNFVEYHNLDVITFIAAVFFVLVYVSLKITVCLAKKLPGLGKVKRD